MSQVVGANSEVGGVDELLSESVVGESVPVSDWVDKVQSGVGLSLPLGNHVVGTTVFGVASSTGNSLQKQNLRS